MRIALFWVITQRIAVISYRRFGITYRSHPQGSRIQRKACSPNTEFIYGSVWAVNPKYRADRLCRNVRKKLPLLAA